MELYKEDGSLAGTVDLVEDVTNQPQRAHIEIATPAAGREWVNVESDEHDSELRLNLSNSTGCHYSLVVRLDAVGKTSSGKIPGARRILELRVIDEKGIRPVPLSDWWQW